jgi:hypothetical protein
MVLAGCSAKERDVAGGQLDVASAGTVPSGSGAAGVDAGTFENGAAVDGGTTSVGMGGEQTGGQIGEATSGGTTGAPTGQARAASSGSAQPAASTVTSGKTGPGITASTIKVGFVYSAELESVTGTADRPDAQALVEGLNREGGIAGRKVEVVWHDWPMTSAQTIEQRHQEICAAFTEDNKVFAVDPYWIPTENLTGCLTARDAMTVYPAGSGSQLSFDAVSFQKYPTHLWTLVTPTPDRLAKPFVGMLKDSGYLNAAPGAIGPTKIGVLVKSPAPNRRGYEKGFVPALKAAGHNVADVAFLDQATTVDELARSEAQVQNTVVRFRSEQITHVVMWDVHGFVHADTFLKYAEQQRYRPKYAFNSTAGPQGTDATSGTDTSEQLHNSVYFSWFPYVDTLVAEPSERTKTCYRWLKEGGRPVPAPPAAGNALGKCQMLLFLKDGLERAAELTAAGFRAAIEQMGTVPGVESPLQRFGPGRHDGAALWQRLEYDFACGATAGAAKRFCWRPKAALAEF